MRQLVSPVRMLSALLVVAQQARASVERIFDVLENLNLTWEVRDGIRAHSWKIEPPPATPD